MNGGCVPSSLPLLNCDLAFVSLDCGCPIHPACINRNTSCVQRCAPYNIAACPNQQLTLATNINISISIILGMNGSAGQLQLAQSVQVAINGSLSVQPSSSIVVSNQASLLVSGNATFNSATLTAGSGSQLTVGGCIDTTNTTLLLFAERAGTIGSFTATSGANCPPPSFARVTVQGSSSHCSPIIDQRLASNELVVLWSIDDSCQSAEISQFTLLVLLLALASTASRSTFA